MRDDNPLWKYERRRRRWRILGYIVLAIVGLFIVVPLWLILRGDQRDQRKLSRRGLDALAE